MSLVFVYLFNFACLIYFLKNNIHFCVEIIWRRNTKFINRLTPTLLFNLIKIVFTHCLSVLIPFRRVNLKYIFSIYVAVVVIFLLLWFYLNVIFLERFYSINVIKSHHLLSSLRYIIYISIYDGIVFYYLRRYHTEI